MRAQGFSDEAHGSHQPCNSGCSSENLCTCTHTDRSLALITAIQVTQGVTRERLQKDPDSKNALCRKDLRPAFDQLNFSQVLLWDQTQASEARGSLK